MVSVGESLGQQYTGMYQGFDENQHQAFTDDLHGSPTVTDTSKTLVNPLYANTSSGPSIYAPTPLQGHSYLLSYIQNFEQLLSGSPQPFQRLPFDHYSMPYETSEPEQALGDGNYHWNEPMQGAILMSSDLQPFEYIPTATNDWNGGEPLPECGPMLEISQLPRRSPTLTNSVIRSISHSDTITAHEKKRCYLESLENYVLCLRQQVELLGLTPPKLDRATRHQGLSSRSMRVSPPAIYCLRIAYEPSAP
jgi:hypothetical protein